MILIYKSTIFFEKIYFEPPKKSYGNFSNELRSRNCHLQNCSMNKNVTTAFFQISIIEAKNIADAYSEEHRQNLRRSFLQN